MTESGTPDSAVGDDPDAPWRPGYTGPEPTPPESPWAQPTTAPEPAPSGPPVDPWSREADVADDDVDADGRAPVDPEEAERARQLAIEQAPSSDGAGVVGVVGLLVVIGLVVAALVAAGLLGDDDDLSSALPEIPESIDERWSADVPNLNSVWIAGGAVIVRSGNELMAFDAESGDELWERPQDGESSLIEISTAGDVVLFLDRSSDSLIATGVDPMTGDELWNRNVAERRNIFELRDRIVEYEFEQETQSGRFAILSPETGLPIGERLRLVDVSTAPPFISAATVDSEETVLYDIDTGERVVVPIDWEEVDALALADGRLLALTREGSLTLYDDDGEVVDELDVTLGDLQEVPENIFTVPGAPAVVVSAGGRSIGVAIDGDVLDVRWSADSEVRLVELTDDGPRAVLQPERAGPDRVLIVDPIDGTTLFEVDSTDLFVRGFESEAFGRNGMVYLDGPSLVAVDASGESLWELEDTGGFVVDGGLLVEITDDGITVYG